MKSTTDNDLLGETPAKAKKDKKAAKSAAKASKGKKAKTTEPASGDAAQPTPEGKQKLSKEEKKALKASKKAAKKEAKKAEKKEKKVRSAEEKAEAKLARRAARKEKKAQERKEAGEEEKIPVDQTPQEVTPIHKLNEKQVELIVYLHTLDGPKAASEIAVHLKTDTQDINKRAKSLIEAKLLTKDDKLKTLDVVGHRQSGLGDLIKFLHQFLEKNKVMPSSAQVGAGLWGDKKNKEKAKLDLIRFGRPAGRLLTAAYNLGVIKLFVQPRRKFSSDKLRKLYAPVA